QCKAENRTVAGHIPDNVFHPVRSRLGKPGASPVPEPFVNSQRIAWTYVAFLDSPAVQKIGCVIDVRVHRPVMGKIQPIGFSIINGLAVLFQLNGIISVAIGGAVQLIVRNNSETDPAVYGNGLGRLDHIGAFACPGDTETGAEAGSID